MNRERKKVIGNIFADAAKYTLTAGIIGSILTGEFIVYVGFSLGLAFVLFALLAYFVLQKTRRTNYGRALHHAWYSSVSRDWFSNIF